jgi:hypothetical protein
LGALGFEAGGFCFLNPPTLGGVGETLGAFCFGGLKLLAVVFAYEESETIVPRANSNAIKTIWNFLIVFSLFRSFQGFFLQGWIS